MGWNVENFGTSKYQKKNGGQELIEFIAEVITHNNVDVAGFSEIRSNLGDKIGADLKAAIAAAGGGLNWDCKPSPQFGKKRWEQYLFVWNKSTIDTYGATPFQHRFLDPTDPNHKPIGFPRQAAADRPPFLGYFQAKAGSQKKLLIAIMHSPGPDSVRTPHKTAQAMAKVSEFKTQGDTCILLGDFNVKKSVDAAVAGTNGKDAFGNLVTALPQPLDQLLNNNLETSLISSKGAFLNMAPQDCFNEPYDQIFFRRSATVTPQNHAMDDLIQDARGGYLEPRLGAIEGKISNAAPVVYPAIENAFEAYRIYVSDYMPVLVDANFA